MSVVSDRRLADLVNEPREGLDVEIKEWLNLEDKAHQATLAKELIALANHGGGFILIGFKEEAGGFSAAPNPPNDLESWTQDRIQGIVGRYLEPTVQCSVSHVMSTVSGKLHPVIVVPSSDRVPVMTKKGSPDNTSLVPNRIYIRRAGPNSEEPRSAEEWNGLFDRLVQSRKSDLLDAFRSILSGVIPTANLPEPSNKGVEFDKFTHDAQHRWTELVSQLPANSPARMPHGHYDMAFAIDGDFKEVSLHQVAQIVATAVRNHSGWPPFLTIPRPPFTPKPLDGAVQCWMKPETAQTENDPSHNDFWRVSSNGMFFTRRGFIEDSARSGAALGKTIDLTVPIWRLGEGILNASYIAMAMGAADCDLICRTNWAGLRGRTLTSSSGAYLSLAYEASQDKYSAEEVVSVRSASEALPEIVYAMLRPMYELFDFFQLSKSTVEKQLADLTRNRF